MTINMYGQLKNMGENPDELKKELEKIVTKYNIKNIDVHLNNPKL